MNGQEVLNISAVEPGDYRFFLRLAVIAIALVFGGLGAWSLLAPLDRAAVAPARVAVEGDRKPIQHLEGGIVREILVHEAELVEEGQVLFRLQPTQAQANADVLRTQIDAAMALEARLLAERNGDASITFPECLLQRRTVPETADSVRDQERHFKEHKRSLDMQVAILKTRFEQTNHDITGKTLRIKSLQDQIASYQQELSAVSDLAKRGYYPRNKLLGMRRELSSLEGDLGATQADKARLDDVLSETRLQIEQIEQNNVEEATKELADVRARLAEMREKLAVAADVLARIEVRSPRRGFVLGLKVHSPGTVVSPGAVLAEVVPASERLLLNARVSPLDVQSVAIGQQATIKFPGLASRQAPTFSGAVGTISADSVTDEGTKETYFSATVSVDRANIPKEWIEKITPGMPADVLITTGERTAFDYLIGPLKDSLSKAMHEH